MALEGGGIRAISKVHPFWVHTALLLLVAIALAGCSSARAKGGPSDPDPFTQPTGFTEDTGSVVGTVVDEELVPLQGAIVGFIDPYQATKTDEAGHFEIGTLKPGDRNLYVIHLGHKAAGKRIHITAGQETEKITFVLPVLPVEGPWIDIVPKTGKFSNAFRIDPISETYNSVTSPSWLLKDNPKALDAIHIQVVWAQQSGVAGGLRVTLSLAGNGKDRDFFTIEGKSPLSKMIYRSDIEAVFQAANGPCIKDPCRLEWTATPATKTTGLAVDAGVMTDQSFTVYVSHFFRMTPKDDYVVEA